MKGFRLLSGFHKIRCTHLDSRSTSNLVHSIKSACCIFWLLKFPKSSKAQISSSILEKGRTLKRAKKIIAYNYIQYWMGKEKGRKYM